MGMKKVDYFMLESIKDQFECTESYLLDDIVKNNKLVLKNNTKIK
jgi:hypothetical protein